MELNGTEAWQKITGFPGTIKLGRMGYIPVFDGESWTWFKNTATIWPGMEGMADPTKVDKLRRSALELLTAFDKTLPELERLGIRVKGLLNKEIKTQADVEAWANSIFNLGPTNGLPVHVEDALALAADSTFKIVVQRGANAQYVLPAPGEAKATLDYNTPGSRTKFGPRHTFTKTAFSIPPPGTVRHPSERPRGRPRKDGLPPGSPEARRADKAKQRLLERERAKRLRARERAKAKKQPQQLATITELPKPPARRVLVRVGKSGVGS